MSASMRTLVLIAFVLFGAWLATVVATFEREAEVVNLEKFKHPPTVGMRHANFEVWALTGGGK